MRKSNLSVADGGALGRLQRRKILNSVLKTK